MNVSYLRTLDQREDLLAYIQLLRSLHEAGAFGRAAIYPSIGVDCFIAQHCLLIGLNLWPYDIRTITQDLSDLVPTELLTDLARDLQQHLLYLPRVDVTRLDVVARMLGSYQIVSPKSLILKGLFESTFLREWDIDSERYYPVSHDHAQARAIDWLGAILKFFTSGDRIVLFDPLMLGAVRAQTEVKEIKVQLPSLDTNPTVVQRGQIPFIYLPRGATLFEYA